MERCTASALSSSAAVTFATGADCGSLGIKPGVLGYRRRDDGGMLAESRSVNDPLLYQPLFETIGKALFLAREQASAAAASLTDDDLEDVLGNRGGPPRGCWSRLAQA